MTLYDRVLVGLVISYFTVLALDVLKNKVYNLLA
jgi:hypothetical protein